MEPHGAGNGSSNCDNDTKSPEDKATKHPRLTYSGKMILAPMVKIGTTPMRLLALHYGAGKAFTCDVVKYLRAICNLFHERIWQYLDVFCIIFPETSAIQGRNFEHLLEFPSKISFLHDKVEQSRF